MVARNPPTRYAVVAVVFEYSTFCGVSWELGSARNVVFKKTHRMWNIWTQLQSGSFLLHAMLIVTIKMMSDILCRNTTFRFVDDTRDISCHMPYCVWKKGCNLSQTGLIWARRPQLLITVLMYSLLLWESWISATPSTTTPCLRNYPASRALTSVWLAG